MVIQISIWRFRLIMPLAALDLISSTGLLLGSMMLFSLPAHLHNSALGAIKEKGKQSTPLYSSFSSLSIHMKSCHCPELFITAGIHFFDWKVLWTVCSSPSMLILVSVVSVVNCWDGCSMPFESAHPRTVNMKIHGRCCYVTWGLLAFNTVYAGMWHLIIFSPLTVIHCSDMQTWCINWAILVCISGKVYV